MVDLVDELIMQKRKILSHMRFCQLEKIVRFRSSKFVDNLEILYFYSFCLKTRTAINLVVWTELKMWCGHQRVS